MPHHANIISSSFTHRHLHWIPRSVVPPAAGSVDCQSSGDAVWSPQCWPRRPLRSSVRRSHCAAPPHWVRSDWRTHCSRWPPPFGWLPLLPRLWWDDRRHWPRNVACPETVRWGQRRRGRRTAERVPRAVLARRRVPAGRLQRRVAVPPLDAVPPTACCCCWCCCWCCRWCWLQRLLLWLRRRLPLDCGLVERRRWRRSNDAAAAAAAWRRPSGCAAGDLKDSQRDWRCDCDLSFGALDLLLLLLCRSPSASGWSCCSCCCCYCCCQAFCSRLSLLLLMLLSLLLAVVVVARVPLWPTLLQLLRPSTSILGLSNIKQNDSSFCCSLCCCCTCYTHAHARTFH